MSNHKAPQTVYLQVCDDEDCTEEFNFHHDVTWSQDQINKTDIRYVRADINAELLEALKWAVDCLHFDYSMPEAMANLDNAYAAIAKAEVAA